MDPIRVLLCNHHPIIRIGLRVLLEREPGISVVGEAANGREATVLAEYKRPHVVLLDIQFSHATGIMAAREISLKAEDVRIVFVSAHADEEYVSEGFKAGARGYVLADSVQTDLTRAIRVVANGGRFLSPRVSSKLLEEPNWQCESPSKQLTENQKTLFCLLAAGYDEQEIAQNLDATFEEARSNYETLTTSLSCFRIPEVIRSCVGWNAQGPTIQSRHNRSSTP